MHSSRTLTQIGILLFDLVVLYLSLYLALLFRNGELPESSSWWIHARHFTPIFVTWIVIFYTIGLYNIDSPFDDRTFAAKLVVGAIVGTLVAALFFYLNLNAQIGPRTLLALFSIIALAFIWLWRYLYGRIKRVYLPKTGIAFVGSDETVRELVEVVAKRAHLGYETVALLDEADAKGRELEERRRSFFEAVGRGDVSLIVVSDEWLLTEETRQRLFDQVSKPVRFVRLPDFYEMLLRKVPIGTINDLWFLENIDLRSKRPYEIGKRIIDILLATLTLLVSSPLWPFIALAVRISSRGPVFFTQVRVGKEGREFTIIKFRTMRVEGNDFTPTGENDSRVTRVGNFLRTSRLDELPQMLNILKGDMSWVGPRPERPELAIELERAIPYYRQRLLVKPGLSGWDQVSGEYHSPSIEDTYKKLQYDLYYVKNVSIFLDVSIFFKTIMTVLLRAGR
jgi:exopolysaccharide biosynthesis polyprenyl glycosylphosphotransferase